MSPSPNFRKPGGSLFGDGLVQAIIAEGMQRSKIEMDIIEFSKDILGVQLWPSQRAILKALYKLPLGKGLWRDIIPAVPWTDEKGVFWPHGVLESYGYAYDEEYDERQILREWALESKTTWVEDSDYSEMVLECGMRGSKTSMTSIPIVYEFFKLLQEDDPAKNFGLMAGSLIALLVLATSEDQAQDTLFAAIKGRIENSPYFQGLIGQKKLIVNSLDIYCPDKQVKLWCGHSRSAGLVGRTLMIFAMDEANRFGIAADGSQNGSSGIDMYANVGKGTTTLRGFGAKKMVISSAWCEGDCTDVLYQKVEQQIEQFGSSHILAFRLCTWDMNPKFTKMGEDHPEIQQEYLTRGIEARRDYAGIRPGAEEAFFNRHLVANMAKYELPIIYIPREREVSGQDGTKRKYASIDVHVNQGAVNPATGIVPSPFFSYGHCDPGLKHDSFGFVAGHPEIDTSTGLVVVNISSVLEWRPIDKGRGLIYPVDYENVEEALLKMAELIRLKRLTFDHWNCYATGSLIATPSGLRRVETLQVGDAVAGKDEINQVVARELVAQQSAVKVKTKFGYEATVTPHHPFWVEERGWVHAGDLTAGDRIRLDDGKDIFGTVHDPLKGLVYGYLAAEGDWSEEANMVRFSNTEADVRHDYASAFQAVFDVEPTENPLGVRCGHDWVRHQITSEMTTGAHNKHVPDFVLQGSRETVGMFLAGLYEGDGNVRLNPKVLSVELNTVSSALAEEVQLLLLRLGIKSSRKHFENKFFKGKRCPFYRVTVYGENIKNFLLAVGFRSTRKRTALNQAVELIPTGRRSRSRNMHTAVTSVTPVTVDIVHLEVSGDHSYVGQGLVGHNSAMIIQRLYSAGISTGEFKSSFSQPVQREIYEITREWLTNGRIKLPKKGQSPAVDKLHKELEELVLLKGKRIDHPKKGSKDLSDCLACVVWHISQDERRYRYFETGSNKIRSSGSIHVASALPDLFEDGETMARRAEALKVVPKNLQPKQGIVRRVRVTKDDWYGPGSVPNNLF